MRVQILSAPPFYLDLPVLPIAACFEALTFRCLGLFQYGLLQLGHCFGSVLASRGSHSLPHRSHTQSQTVFFTLAMRSYYRK